MAFNENTRVKIPAILHLCRLGYAYKSLWNAQRDEATNIFTDIFEESTLRINDPNFPIVNSELKITEAAIRDSATDLLPKGTTLLSITRHLRPTVLAIDACANQSVVGIKEKDDVKYYFIYPYLKNEIPRLLRVRTGAQQPHINKETVDDSLVVLPHKDADTLKLYNSQVGCLYEQILNNSFQNRRLAELRDWLLPMLMNGQVTVNERAHETA